jgi:hypothetical protein
MLYDDGYAGVQCGSLQFVGFLFPDYKSESPFVTDCYECHNCFASLHLTTHRSRLADFVQVTVHRKMIPSDSWNRYRLNLQV